jgi:hypothetical protein
MASQPSEDLLDDGFSSDEERNRSLFESRERDWRATVAAYAARPTDFYQAWYYLEDHPIFWGDHVGTSYFGLILDQHVARINPATGQVDSDPACNTQMEIWLEAGPTYVRSERPDDERWQEARPDETVIWNVHDPRLDCGGPTHELAIIVLAQLVRERYGDDRSRVYHDVG